MYGLYVFISLFDIYVPYKYPKEKINQMECYSQYIWSHGVYQEKVFSSRDVRQIFFSIWLRTAEKSGLWYGSEGRCFSLCSLSVMAEPGGYHTGREVRLPQISYSFYSYMVNRNLAFLASVLSWKCLRDFFSLTRMGQQGRVSCLLPSPVDAFNLTISHFYPPL